MTLQHKAYIVGEHGETFARQIFGPSAESRWLVHYDYQDEHVMGDCGESVDIGLFYTLAADRSDPSVPASELQVNQVMMSLNDFVWKRC